jgi:hypothetical protein
MVPAIHIHPRTAVDLIRFYESDDQVPVTKSFNIGFSQAGVQYDYMRKRRPLLEDYLPLFEMNLEPVAVDMIELILFQKIEKHILAKTMFAIKAFIIVYKVWHRISPLKKKSFKYITILKNFI